MALVDTAESFSYRQVQALQPSCMQSIDVSGYYLVAPLTLNQISLLYWNLYAVLARAEISTQQTREIKEDDLRLISYDAVFPTEPKNRLCEGAVGEVNVEAVHPEDYYETGGGYYVTICGANTRWNVIKMYNGEDFLGYGISSEDDWDSSSDGYGVYNGELAYAGALEDGGQGRAGELKVITSYCKYDPNPEVPYEFESEENQWFFRFCIPGITGCTAEKVSLKGGQAGSFPFIQMSWSNLGLYGTAEILSLELYSYVGPYFNSSVQDDDGPPVDDRDLIDIPIIYQVLYLTPAYGAFGGYIGDLPYPTNYSPKDRIDYESILYAEYKSLELYGDVYPSQPRKDAFFQLREEFFSLRNFYDINAFEVEEYEYPSGADLYFYDGFVNLGQPYPTFQG